MVAGFFLFFFLTIFLIYLYISEKKNKQLTTPEKYSIMEKRCQLRIREMEGHISELEKLLIIADEKIMCLMDQNQYAEENRLHGMSQPSAGNQQKSRHEIEAIISSKLDIAMNNSLRDMKHEIRAQMEKHRISEEADAIVNQPKPGPIDFTAPLMIEPVKQVEKPKIFPEHTPGYFRPDLSAEEHIEERYRNIHQLAASGLSPSQISEMVRMETSTINLILGISSDHASKKRKQSMV
jgi:hypothetical protein